MEKNILLEINRNLELMGGKQLLIEAKYPTFNPKIPNKIFDNLKSFERYITKQNLRYKLPQINDLIKKLDDNYPKSLEIASEFINNPIFTYGEKILFFSNLFKINYVNLNQIVEAYTNIRGTVQDRELFLNYYVKSFSESDVGNFFKQIIPLLSKTNKNHNRNIIKFYEKFYDFVKNKNINIDLGQLNQKIDAIFSNPNIAQNVKFNLLLKLTGLNKEKIYEFYGKLLNLYNTTEINTLVKTSINDFLVTGDELSRTRLQDVEEIKKLFEEININDGASMSAILAYLPFFYKKGAFGGRIGALKGTGAKVLGEKTLILFARLFPIHIKHLYDALSIFFISQKRSKAAIEGKLISIINDWGTALNSIEIYNDSIKKGIFPAKPPNFNEIKFKYEKQIKNLLGGYILITNKTLAQTLIPELKKIINVINTNKQFENDKLDLIQILNEQVKELTEASTDAKVPIKFIEFLDTLDSIQIDPNIRPASKKETIFDLMFSTYHMPIDVNNVKKTLTERIKNIVSADNLKKILTNGLKTVIYGAPINPILIRRCFKIYKDEIIKNKGRKGFPKLFYQVKIILHAYLTYVFVSIIIRFLYGIFITLANAITLYPRWLFDQQYNLESSDNSKWQGLVNNNYEKAIIEAKNNNESLIKTFLFYELKKNILPILENTINSTADKDFTNVLKSFGSEWYKLLIPPELLNFETGIMSKVWKTAIGYITKEDYSSFIAAINDVLYRIKEDLLKSLRNINLNQTNTTSTTNQIINKTYIYDSMYNKTFVPYFTYENIKSIKLNNIDISRNVIKNQRGGIIIKDVQRNDVENIVITSKYNNNIYKLKN